ITRLLILFVYHCFSTANIRINFKNLAILGVYLGVGNFSYSFVQCISNEDANRLLTSDEQDLEQEPALEPAHGVLPMGEDSSN
ncbi:MAG: hypothetical protein LBN29_06840, partial [Mediterranea sp.]|nr:hypothetical protein [Mediterranea sp.]